MPNQKRILINIPEDLLLQVDEFAEKSCVNRSEFMREAMRFYLRECKRREIGELMKKGYAEMGIINLSIAEGCLAVDNMQLKNYEERLSECEFE